MFEAVKQCYASMWETRLFEYRKNVGFKSVDALAMAVVVQQQVEKTQTKERSFFDSLKKKKIDSEAAGVAFSMNPVNGNPTEVMVESCWGQGEGLVGGTITPHSWTVNWPISPKIVQRNVSVQQTKLACVAKHVESVPTSEHEKKHPPLSDEQALKVLNFVLSLCPFKNLCAGCRDGFASECSLFCAVRH